MKRPVAIRLNDMLAMIDAVAEMVEGVEFAGFRADLKLRLAIERAIEVVSEASRHIPSSEKDRFSHLPWTEIAAIGNKLRHEYQRVDDHIIWDIAVRGLPDLRSTVLLLLESSRGGS